jgi:indole-3-glycerol phosphate synthase
MATILEEITARKRHDLVLLKEQHPAGELYREAERMMDNDVHHSLPEALLKSRTGIIAEFKRKSPSLGWIREEARPEDIVPKYAANGATALSILTDEPYFGGQSEYITRVRPLVNIPILRKDFTIDEYQIFEAKTLGADAILLIAACLGKDECRQLTNTARELNLDVLLEIHEERELDYLTDHVSVVGVNNRNLHLFKTDLTTSFRLSATIPEEFVKISESGLKKTEDIRLLRAAGYNGFLTGERLMKTKDPGAALAQLLKELES